MKLKFPNPMPEKLYRLAVRHQRSLGLFLLAWSLFWLCFWLPRELRKIAPGAPTGGTP